MHYHAEIYIKENKNVDEQVNNIMIPYYIEIEDNEKAFWDWYVIGGRWTGAHDNYEPEKDESNYEVCIFCKGTGDRNFGGDMWVWYDIDNNRHFTYPWAEHSNGCNACHGTGMSLKHPPKWIRHDKDIMPVSEIGEDLDCHTLIVDDKIFHTEEWSDHVDDFIHTQFSGDVKEMLNRLNITDGYLVTVDYHC